MAKLRFTDELIAAAPYVPVGTEEQKVPDPLLARHRCTIKATKKVFEIQAERPKKFGSRKTYVRTTGVAPMDKIADARERAEAMLRNIDAGLEPEGNGSTLGEAWERFKERKKIRQSTLDSYEATYERRLKHWAGTSLKTLSEHPSMAEDYHKKLTKDSGPSEANHALELLRMIYREQAKRDRTLDRNKHPCTSVEWNATTPRDAGIPSEMMPAWGKQLEVLRDRKPVRACFQMLNLRLGTRPGELARAKWSDIEERNGIGRVLVLPTTKTHIVEVPLCPQIEAELELARELRDTLWPACPYIFATGPNEHLTKLTEVSKADLSHSGNSGRHTHHQIGAEVGTGLGLSAYLEELALDVLEGRSLLRAKCEGRGYLARSEFGRYCAVLQARTNDRIDALIAG